VLEEEGFDLEIFVNDISARVLILEEASKKPILYRMRYLTWCLANPISLVFIPFFGTVLVEILIFNVDNTYTEWTLNSLTKSVNWTIPIIVAVLGFLVSFGNKLYELIQERGDMDIIGVLDAKINGLNRRFEIENRRREDAYKAEQEKKEAAYKAEQEKRDLELKENRERYEREMKELKEKHEAEMKTVLSEIRAIKLAQVSLEAKQG
jgi:hypothetical protein